VVELDRLLDGGLESGTSNLIMGPSGTLKTTLGVLFAIQAATEGVRSRIYLFDERKVTLLHRLKQMQIDIETPVKEGLIDLQEIEAGETSPGHFAGVCKKAIDEDGVRIILVDSLQGYLQSMPWDDNLITHMHDLLNFLSRHDVISIIVVTQQGILDTVVTDDTINLSYLADTVMLVRHFEAFGEVRKAISVVKKRTGRHETSVREIKIGPEGIDVGSPLSDFTGVLTGTIQFTGTRKELLGDEPE
jgi:circadian clock protein KaiC